MILILSLTLFTDKSPQMNEFLSQIKQSTELAAMFESIQKDAQTSPTDIMMMDTSWVSQTLESLSGSLECLCKRIERVIDIKCCVSVEMMNDKLCLYGVIVPGKCTNFRRFNFVCYFSKVLLLPIVLLLLCVIGKK